VEKVLIILTSVVVGLLVGGLLGYLILWLQKKPFLKKYYWDRMLTITLVVAILGALGLLGYVIATPKAGETFTEFYILGQEGKAADYPKELKVGDEGRVIVGVVNHEGKGISYRVKVVINGKGNAEVGPVVLVHEQKWEGEVSFVPEAAGENQRVEFLLYKDDEVEPCLKLHLWMDVKE